ncbi:MAG: carboxypeptidase-like regulatory domain-containing protein, partial [Chitinophagales bacterium]|nr:carboxypeptidase-like regulatory domain-containing protein [Chitinophagales bacterium]
MSRALLGIILSALISVAKSQNAKIYGKVTDEKDGTPLAGVSILQRGTTNGTISNDEGAYELILPAGTHTIDFSYTGYAKNSMVVTLLPGKSKELNVQMGMEEKEMEIIVVTGTKYEKKLSEEITSMEVLRANVIQQNNARMDEAMNKVPGVNMLGRTISIRGGSGFSDATSNRVLALLDEMPVISPENGGIIWDMIPIEGLEQVEVIKGSSSAIYGSSALNGVMNLRTLQPKPEMVNKILINYGLYDQPRQRTWNYWWVKEKIKLNGDTVSRVQHPMFGGVQFTHAKQYGVLGVVVTGAYQQDAGFRQSNDYKRARMMTKLRYTPKKLSNLTTGLNIGLFHQNLKDFFASKGVGKLMYIPTEIAITTSRTFTVDPYVNYYDKKDNKHSVKLRWFGTMYYSSIGDSSTCHQFSYDYSFYKRFQKINLNIAAGTNGFYSHISGKTFGNLVADITKIKYFNARDVMNFAAYVQAEKKFFQKLTVS